MPQINLKNLKDEAQKEIEKAKNLRELEGVFRKYLGRRSGHLTQVLRSLKELPEGKRARLGKEANELKNFLEIEIKKRAEKIQLITTPTREAGRFDITVPAKKPILGHLHPLSQVKTRMEEIFGAIGFSVIEGPDIETEWYNFDALNIPAEHPARDAWDTFWLKEKDSKNKQLLLRTHTSPVQIRYMEKHRPPLRIIVPGRIFRHEATDASHDFQFYHLEGLMVDRNISVPHFKAILGEFFKEFFEKFVKVRLRPSFFPFTEPSFEVDMSCLACEGKGFILSERSKSKGCSVCKKTGWLEVMGAGMVHPYVFKNAGLNPKDWQGFAFGMGVDRLTMMKYKINDIRLLHSGDLRFLNQF